MMYTDPIIYGTDRDHTKVYATERHCYNCQHFDDTNCRANVQINGMFQFKDEYPIDRQRVYLGRVLAGVCKTYTIKGKDWDK